MSSMFLRSIPFNYLRGRGRADRSTADCRRASRGLIPVTVSPPRWNWLLVSSLSATAPVATPGFQLSTKRYRSVVPAANQPGQIVCPGEKLLVVEVSVTLSPGARVGTSQAIPKQGVIPQRSYQTWLAPVGGLDGLMNRSAQAGP